MRVNIYAEEMTNRVEIITKETPEGKFTGVRFYLELPVTTKTGVSKDHTGKETDLTTNISGPFIHHPGDDDSAAVTYWGKRDLETVLQTALDALKLHYRDHE